MPITLNGSGSLTGVSVGGLPDGIVQLADLGPTTGKNGPILQVVSTTKTDTFSETVASATNSAIVTGLTVSITPSASTNKILILYNIPTSLQALYVLLDKGGSVITDSTGDAASNRARMTSSRPYNSQDDYVGVISGNYLDTAGSTSALTYGIRLRHSSGSNQTLYVNRSGLDQDSAVIARTSAVITAMEVAA